MNATWNHIARSIFERPDVENISLDEMDYLVEEYPYFPIIHFLRTRKILADQLPESDSGAARTALYFPNPHWLQYQLDGIIPAGEKELPLAEIMTTPSQVEELTAVIPEEHTVPAAEVIQEESEMNFDDKRIFSASETIVAEDKVISEEISEATEEISDSPEEFSEATVEFSEVTKEISEATEEINEATEEISEMPEEIIEAPEELNDATVEPGDLTDESGEATHEPDHLEDPAGYEEEIPVEGRMSVEALLAEEEIPAEFIPGIEESFAETSFEEESVQEEVPQALLADLTEEKAPVMEPPLNISLPEMDKHAGEESFQIPIEPLYTIDYFASQGIRLRQEEEQQTDLLSVKLRSFTEWLKAMKKIHPEKLDQKMGQEEENNIRVYAESSNEPRELYTEALAEVYLQQGLRQKALMVFEKLSLLDPSKSAYFAARIREIKEN